MSKLYIKSDEILFQEIDNEGLLLNLESGRYLRINSTATEIWNELMQVQFEAKTFHTDCILGARASRPL